MLKRLVMSFMYALRGLYFAFKSELNFRIHIIAMCVAVGMGIYVNLSAVKWGLVTFAIGFVLVSELFNTALERLGDETAGGKHNTLVGTAKDISAAAVFVSALAALGIGIIFLLIPFLRKLF
jgi:diacylglycerol kinase (ATP)